MSLSNTIDILQELQRMHQLNIELLETLAIACSHITKNHVDVPNESTFISLLGKAWALLDEIKADEPRIIQYTTNSRRKVTPFRTDEDVPVPTVALFKGVAACSEEMSL